MLAESVNLPTTPGGHLFRIEAGMEKRKREQHTTDHLQGIIRGEAFQSDCTVALITKLDHGKPTVGVWTSLRIMAAAQTPPDGIYRLEVHGRMFNVRRVGGQWATIQL
jgi:hypothetical protein